MPGGDNIVTGGGATGVGADPALLSSRIVPRPGDWVGWDYVNLAIREEAERLCRSGCDSDCRRCGAGSDPAWRRDAINSLKADFRLGGEA